MATVKTTGRVAMTNIDTGEIFGMWDGEQAITIRSVEDYEKAKTKGEVAQSKNDKLSTISKSYWDYGRFFWSLYDTASALFSQLKPATLTRIMVLGTYMNYENELVEDNGVTMTQLGIQNALGVSERMTRYILGELKTLDIITENERVYLLNPAFFTRGRISEADLSASFDDGKSVKRVYADGVRALYHAASQASVKKLCPLFRIMPYVNKEYNIVCFITAIVKAYDVGAHQIEATMDKMVTVGNNFPISVRQLAEGMNNAGSALSSSGNSFDQSLALLAAANTTVQNISKSSTGLRTIAARIRNTKTELDELGEAMTDAEYDNLVQSLTRASVSLTDAKGELRSTYDILQDIANVWGNMTKNDQAALAETLAGTRQQNIFYSLINQFNEASKAMDAMTSSAGAMSSANSVYMESVGAKADRMEASFQELSSTLLDSSIIGWLYDFGNAALNAVSAFDAWPAKIALVAAGLPTLIGLFREFKHMPLIDSIGGSFKDLARPKMTGRNWNWANHLEEAA